VKQALLRSAAFAVLLLPMAAAAQTRSSTKSADIYAEGGYSTRTGSGSALSGGSGFLRAGILPRIVLSGPRTTLSADGEVQLYQYFRFNRRDVNYRANASIANQFSQNTSGTLSLRFSDRELDRFTQFVPGTGVSYIDPALLGTRTRTRGYGAIADVSTILSPRSSLNVTGGWSGARYGATSTGFGLSNFDTWTGSLGYNRQLSARATIGVQANYQRSTYSSAFFPNSTGYGGAAVFKLKLDPLWTLDATIGAMLRDLGSAAPKDVFLTGTASLCRQGSRSSLCFNASRSVGNSGAAGSDVNLLAAAYYSLKTGLRNSVTLNVEYARSTRATVVTNQGKREFATGTLGYNMQVTERLGLTTSAYFRKGTGPYSLGEDFGGQLGLKYRVGDLP